MTYQTGNQQNLTVNVKKNAHISLNSGLVDTLSGAVDDDALLSTSDAAVTNVKLSVSSNADVELGTVRALDITHSGSCPAGRQANVSVWNAESLTVNGVSKSLQDARLTCLTLSVEGEEDDRS